MSLHACNVIHEGSHLVARCECGWQHAATTVRGASDAWSLHLRQFRRPKIVKAAKLLALAKEVASGD